MCTKRNLKITAFHESGHAFMGNQMGIDVAKVFVNTANHQQGATAFVHNQSYINVISAIHYTPINQWIRTNISLVEVEGVLLIMLAGAISEFVYKRKKSVLRFFPIKEHTKIPVLSGNDSQNIKLLEKFTHILGGQNLPFYVSTALAEILRNWKAIKKIANKIINAPNYTISQSDINQP